MPTHVSCMSCVMYVSCKPTHVRCSSSLAIQHDVTHSHATSCLDVFKTDVLKAEDIGAYANTPQTCHRHVIHLRHAYHRCIQSRRHRCVCEYSDMPITCLSHGLLTLTCHAYISIFINNEKSSKIDFDVFKEQTCVRMYCKDMT